MRAPAEFVSFVRRTLVLARAEVLHVVRDRATLMQILVGPLIQLLVFSNAATFAIRASPLWVVDQDGTSVSRGLADRLGASAYFAPVGWSASPEPANQAMLSGRATLVLSIPSGFEQQLVRDGRSAVHLDVNAEKGSAAGVVQSYASQIIDQYGRDLWARLHPRLASALDASAGEPAPAIGRGRIEPVARAWFNPTLNYKYFMVPGILVAVVMIVGTLVTAQNIAREKEMGTIEQLNVTPITRAEFITAKLLPFWVLALIDLAVGLLVARLVFGVPLRGSLLLLFGSAAVYLIVGLGIGLWISTMVDTQQQAMFVTFFVLMIYLLMGGLFTPVDSMPDWIRVVADLNPVRHFTTILRGILMRGAGVEEVARPLGLLAVYAVVVMTLAIRRYRKRTS